MFTFLPILGNPLLSFHSPKTAAPTIAENTAPSTPNRVAADAAVGAGVAEDEAEAAEDGDEAAEDEAALPPAVALPVVVGEAAVPLAFAPADALADTLAAAVNFSSPAVTVAVCIAASVPVAVVLTVVTTSPTLTPTSQGMFPSLRLVQAKPAAEGMLKAYVPAQIVV